MPRARHLPCVLCRDRGPRLRCGDISYDYPSHRWVTKSLPRAAVYPRQLRELRPYNRPRRSVKLRANWSKPPSAPGELNAEARVGARRRRADSGGGGGGGRREFIAPDYFRSASSVRPLATRRPSSPTFTPDYHRRELENHRARRKSPGKLISRATRLSPTCIGRIRLAPFNYSPRRRDVPSRNPVTVYAGTHLARSRPFFSDRLRLSLL